MSMIHFGKYFQVKSVEQLSNYMDECMKQDHFGFDIENHGGLDFDPYTGEITGFSLSARPEEGCYVPLGHIQAGVNLDRTACYNVIRTPLQSGKSACHNLGYEWKWMKVKLGIEMKMGLCTQVLAFLDDPNRTWGDDPRSLKLKELMNELFKIDPPSFEEVLKLYNAQNFSQVPMEGAIPYGAADSDFSLRLKQVMYQRVSKSIGNILAVELALVPVLARQELRGIMVEPIQLKQAQEAIELQLVDLKLEAFKLMGFDPAKNLADEYEWPFDLNSPSKVSDHFFGVMGIPTDGIRQGKSGQFSSSKKSLENIRDKYPAVNAVLVYKEAEHMKNNFLGRLTDYINPITGMVHGGVNQTGVPTGRLSHSQPNLAQIPKKRD